VQVCQNPAKLNVLFASNWTILALEFFRTHSPTLNPTHSAILHHLSTILLPSHVQTDELARRFRSEKYRIRMTRSGIGLLTGWLMEGVGGEEAGAGEGIVNAGSKGTGPRAAIMMVVNDRLKFDGQSELPYVWYPMCD
jgi:transcription initiation factor TFIID subunit 5